jgi:hypothetical protein
MRKVCAQAVESAGKLVGKLQDLCTGVVATTGLGDKTRDLYRSFKHALRPATHSKNLVFVSVSRQFLPTIHSTYKHKQKNYSKYYSY